MSNMFCNVWRIFLAITLFMPPDGKMELCHSPFSCKTSRSCRELHPPEFLTSQFLFPCGSEHLCCPPVQSLKISSAVWSPDYISTSGKSPEKTEVVDYDKPSTLRQVPAPIYFKERSEIPKFPITSEDISRRPMMQSEESPIFPSEEVTSGSKPLESSVFPLPCKYEEAFDSGNKAEMSQKGSPERVGSNIFYPEAIYSVLAQNPLPIQSKVSGDAYAEMAFGKNPLEPLADNARTESVDGEIAQQVGQKPSYTGIEREVFPSENSEILKKYASSTSNTEAYVDIKPVKGHPKNSDPDDLIDVEVTHFHNPKKHSYDTVEVDIIPEESEILDNKDASSASNIDAYIDMATAQNPQQNSLIDKSYDAVKVDIIPEESEILENKDASSASNSDAYIDMVTAQNPQQNSKGGVTHFKIPQKQIIMNSGESGIIDEKQSSPTAYVDMKFTEIFKKHGSHDNIKTESVDVRISQEHGTIFDFDVIHSEKSDDLKADSSDKGSLSDADVFSVHGFSMPWDHRNRKLLPDNCGSPLISNKIVEGEDAAAGDYPWMVLIGFTGYNGKTAFVCGGTLITDRYVLTAAHCLHKDGAKLTHVRLGEFDLSTHEDCNGEQCYRPAVDLDVEKIIAHDNWNEKTFRNDIGLLRLNSSVASLGMATISPICLPVDTLNISDSDKFEVAGWGLTGWREHSLNNILQKTTLSGVNESQCNNVICPVVSPAAYCPIRHSQMCVQGVRKRDVCKGDSGGPLTTLNTLRTIQIGITSFKATEICGEDNIPTVFTRLDRYVDWILDHIEP